MDDRSRTRADAPAHPASPTHRTRRRTGRRSLRGLVLAVAAATVLALVSPATSVAPAEAARAQASSRALAPSTYEARVQRWVNRKRASHGLPRLRMSTCPDRTAERWSRHLARTGRFYHQSMSKVLDRCNARYAGETLGRGSMRPRRLVRMWMNSPGHRAILLSRKARRVGIGATGTGAGRWVVTANFVRY